MKLTLTLTIIDASGVKFSLPWKEKIDPFDLTAEPSATLAATVIETFRRGAAELIDQTEESTAGLLDRIQEHAEEQRRGFDPAQARLPGELAEEKTGRRSRTLPKADEPEAGA